MEKLADAYSTAKDNGVPPDQFAAMCAFMASNTLAAGQDGEIPDPNPNDVTCPECGVPVQDVDASGGIGSDTTLEPCGHAVDLDRLPGEAVMTLLD